MDRNDHEGEAVVTLRVTGVAEDWFGEEWVTYSDGDATLRRSIEVHRMMRWGEPRVGSEVTFQVHEGTEVTPYGPIPTTYTMTTGGPDDTRGVCEEVGKRVPRKTDAGSVQGQRSYLDEMVREPTDRD